MSGRVALVKIDKVKDDEPISVLLVEVVTDNSTITITDQPGRPVSDAIRQKAEELIRLVQDEQGDQ